MIMVMVMVRIRISRDLSTTLGCNARRPCLGGGHAEMDIWVVRCAWAMLSGLCVTRVMPD